MRIFKFAIVGASGVVVNLAILWLLTELAGLFYLLSAVASIEVSIVTNFLLNEHWTFSDRRSGGSMLTRGVKFNCVSVVAMAVNIAVLFALTQYAGLYYMISELAGIAAGFLLNFFLNLKWTWV
ncbi:MAG: GtrA family protein [Candidatus Aenigmarchaeota archaeon]|nr:GtrA family protein [Candidatus Aenigmarchaeota archaeon]